jgi:hypothetical protein
MQMQIEVKGDIIELLINLINQKFTEVKDTIELMLMGRDPPVYSVRSKCTYVCRFDVGSQMYVHYLLRGIFSDEQYDLPLRDDMKYDVAFLYDALQVMDEVEWRVFGWR